MRMIEKAVTKDWTPSQPLKEDIHLQEFPPLQDAHTSLHMDTQKRLDLSAQQEVCAFTVSEACIV